MISDGFSGQGGTEHRATEGAPELSGHTESCESAGGKSLRRWRQHHAESAPAVLRRRADWR